jgi:hypothetical protein
MQWQEWDDAANDETRWQNHIERGLLKAEYLYGYVLRLWFEEELDVAIYELDFYPLMVTGNRGGVFEVLKDQGRFSLVEGTYALIWPNPDSSVYDEGVIGLAPECVRFFCERYGKKVRAGQHAAALGSSL